jgi:Ca-activated chloride channel family protein
MAEEGRGEVEYVALNDDGSKAARRFHERVHTPLLTDVAIDWNGLPISDVYPKRIPDLFAAKPVVLTGRFHGPARGSIRLRGKVAGRDYSRSIPVVLPEARPEHDVLATLWARTRIDDIMRQDWQGVQRGTPRDDVKAEITRLGLKFRLMTQFTSFVAVEEKRVVEGGTPRIIQVPVEMPHGVSYQGVFGEDRQERAAKTAFFAAGGLYSTALPAAPPRALNEPAAQARQTGSRDESEATSKLAPELAALVSGRPLPSYAANLLVNGKVKVKVWLLDQSPSALEALKKAGLEALAKPVNNSVTGAIDVARLKDLASLAIVQYVSPDLGEPR